jgi:hypothetical protein
LDRCAAACIALLLAAAPAEAAPALRRSVVVECVQSCNPVARALRRMGAEVALRSDGQLAVRIDAERLPEIPMVRGIRAASKEPPGAPSAVARLVAPGRGVTLETGDPGLIRTFGAADRTDQSLRTAELVSATASGKVAQNDLIPVLVQVPAGTRELSFVLLWKSEPSDDVDLIVLSPDGHAEVDGATLRNPERTVVAHPTPGIWTAFVNGFAMHGRAGQWQLGVSADGVALASR